jgi:hypothetical protein
MKWWTEIESMFLPGTSRLAVWRLVTIRHATERARKAQRMLPLQGSNRLLMLRQLRPRQRQEESLALVIPTMMNLSAMIVRLPLRGWNADLSA